MAKISSGHFGKMHSQAVLTSFTPARTSVKEEPLMSQFPKAQMTTAAPTIERTCADYLAVRSSFPCHSASADSPRADERENAIDMLRSFVHYNGHRALSPAEASSFERQLQTTSDLSDYRGFEQTFGPNKLPALIASCPFKIIGINTIVLPIKIVRMDCHQFIPPSINELASI